MNTLRFLAALIIGLTSFASLSRAIPSFEGRMIEVTEIKSNTKFFDVLKGHRLPNGERVLIPTLEGSDHVWLGACLSESAKCAFNYDYKDRLLQVYKRAMYAESAVPSLQAQQLEATIRSTTQIFDKGSYVHLKVKTNFNRNGSKEYRVRIAPGHENIKINLSPSYKMHPDRRSFGAVDASLKNLAQGVIMLKGSNFLGTAFFISKKGLLMTNYHVIAGMQGCLIQLRCTLTVERIEANGEVNAQKAEIKILASDSTDDFALLQIDPKLFKNVFVFEADESTVGPNLVTLGFPADLRSTSAKTILTYSFGGLIGLSGPSLLSSTYLTGGASGSPLLNLKNSKLVGLVTARYGNSLIEGTGPGMSRSIHYLNSRYKTKWYISGQMWAYVNQVISKLKQAQTPQETRKLIQSYVALKTFIGIQSMYTLMATHPSAEVRIAILEELKKANYLIGG